MGPWLASTTSYSHPLQGPDRLLPPTLSGSQLDITLPEHRRGLSGNRHLLRLRKILLQHHGCVLQVTTRDHPWLRSLLRKRSWFRSQLLRQGTAQLWGILEEKEVGPNDYDGYLVGL